MDADTKLVPTWFIGGRDAGAAYEFMSDLESRLTHRVQLTTDGHKAYLSAVAGAFGTTGIDYAMLVKMSGADPQEEHRYSPALCIAVESAGRMPSQLDWSITARRCVLANPDHSL